MVTAQEQNAINRRSFRPRKITQCQLVQQPRCTQPPRPDARQRPAAPCVAGSPHFAQPARRTSRRRLAASAPSPPHLAPRASAPPLHAPHPRNAQWPAPRDNRAGLWQEWFSKPQGKESAIRKVEGRGATTCRTPRKAERLGAQRRTAPLTKEKVTGRTGSPW